MFEYPNYIKLFNTGDDAALVERYFADDIVFSGGSREMRGKSALLEFLNWAHDGVREVIREQIFMRKDNTVFAEVDMDFHASKERPEFPFGHLHPGDLVTVKFFVTYQLRDEKIVRLKSMTWPPEQGVTKAPRLGGHASQIAAFGAYSAAFSNADFERFPKFYTDDVTLELGSIPTIKGRQGIIDFYKPMFARVRERITVHKVLADDTAISLDATTRFTAVEEAPDFVVGSLHKGEYIEGRVFVHYALRDGLISSIRVGRAGEMIKHTRS